MKILAIDPGEKRLGLAISDPTGTLARPLMVLEHESFTVNAAKITAVATQHQVEKIIIGQALNDDGSPSYSGRKASRLAVTLRSQTSIPVELWDESFSTNTAKEIQIELGVPVKKRKGHLDAHAAAVILQSYLDAQTQGT